MLLSNNPTLRGQYLIRSSAPRPAPSPAAVLKACRGGSSRVVRCHLLPDEAAQALQILAVQFNVIVARSLHPQRLHRLGAALEQSQAMGEVDHLVLCAVDNQHGGCDFRYFLDAKKTGKNKS